MTFPSLDVMIYDLPSWLFFIHIYILGTDCLDLALFGIDTLDFMTEHGFAWCINGFGFGS